MKFTHMAVSAALAATLGAAALPALAIVGGQPTNSFKAVGIGVQVAPDWVMTVRHTGFTAGTTYENGYGMRTVAAVFVPNAAEFPADDFMLLRLVPTEGTGGLAYPQVSSHLYLPDSFRPLGVTIVSPANHSPRGLGLTLVQEAALTYDDDGPGPLGPVSVNWLISYDTQVRLESGDSGGGLFRDHVRDAGVLIGLASASLTDESGTTIGSAFVQPAAYRAWIESVMATDLSDDQQLLWASAVPEPATALLWAAGLALLGMRRRP